MATATLSRRRLNFTNWQEVQADVDELRTARYDRAGNWDLSQILQHVGEGLRTAVSGTPHRVPWVLRTFPGPIFLRRILRERKMQAGVRVPKWVLPGPSHDESAAVEQFRAAVSAFEHMTTTPFPHPFFGTLTKQQWNDLSLIHASHHLSFLVPRA